MKEELQTKLNEYKEKLASIGRYLWLTQTRRRNKKIRRFTKSRWLLAKCW